MNTWLEDGTTLVLAGLDGLSDEELEAATALPGWTRRHLLAHLASNAEAIGRLVHWARTGEPTPMYSSPRQRAADIEAGAALPVAQLRAWVRRSADELAGAMATVPEQAWSSEVRTAQGRTVPASESRWMRAREVNIHAVDLGVGVGWAQLPGGFCAALVDDIAGWRSGRGDGPALRLSDGEREWQVSGIGEPVSVRRPAAELAAYLCGRGTPDELPVLPRWL